jgi:hypothetical protein
MKLFSLFFLLALSIDAYSQIKQTAIDKKDIPASVHYTGHIINSVRYTDKQGDYLMITTETGIVNVKDEETLRKADIYAYCFKTDAGQPVLLWQMHDFAIECPVDVTARYVPHTFAITDLDKNGIAEVWLMYSTACRGDVSSASLKIIMHEGEKKYAMRGTTKVKLDATSSNGGDYKFDDAFKQSPDTFRQYASKLWDKNVLETW